MPIFSANYRKSFKWQLNSSGVPVAQVFDLAGHCWVTACPLCGAWHELSDRPKDGQVVTPRCLLREFAEGCYGRGTNTNWTRLYDEWCKKHPGARDLRQIAVQLLPKADRPAVAADGLAPAKAKKAAPAKAAKKPRTRKKKQPQVVAVV